jgi:hypothetical protein
MLEARWVLGGACVLMLSACSDTADEPNEERGELGRGVFSYECFGETDLACRSGSPAFPSGIAVGGRFQVDYDPGQGVSPSIIPASDSIAELPGGFQMLRPGYAALFAVDGNRLVEDLVHLRGAVIDEIRVSVDGGLPVSTLRVEAGGARALSAIPVDEYDVPLAGALSYEWSSEDDSIAFVETLEAVDQVQVRGVSEGTTQLLIVVGDTEFALPVEVLPAGAPLPEEPEAFPDEGPGPAPVVPGPTPNDDVDAGAPTGDAGATDAGSDAGTTERPDGGAPVVLDSGADDAVDSSAAALDGGQP